MPLAGADSASASTASGLLAADRHEISRSRLTVIGAKDDPHKDLPH